MYWSISDLFLNYALKYVSDYIIYSSDTLFNKLIITQATHDT